MKKFYIKENSNPNYVATICRVGEIHPIEGADKICRTIVNGYDIVVGKDTKEGDIVVYVPVETAICDGFLAANNLYEISEWERNANHVEVGELLNKVEEAKAAGDTEKADELYKEAKSMVGYFNKRNRVRIVTLKGIASNGFVAGVNSLVKYDKELANIDWESLVDTQFNHIGDEEFCWKYIPPVKEHPERNSQKHFNKRMKKIKRFDRLVENQFAFHYDTVKLEGANIAKFLNPDSMVTITTKVHGTSIILANILVNRKLSVWEKIKKFFGAKVQLTEYGNVYSSRSVIKNRYVNPGKGHDFYGVDIWGCVNRDFAPYLEKGMTVYGEVAGYIEGSDKMIQKVHDYGCKVGQWKFMPYRITVTDELGNTTEWNVEQVDAWTHKLVEEHPELADKVLFLEILYHGRCGDIFPELDETMHWHENFLQALKNDKERFYMEETEHLCHLYESEAVAAKELYEKAVSEKQAKKTIAKLMKEYEKWENMRAPHEGVVIRIDDDPRAEAFKVKCNRHYMYEALQHDSGEVDIEELAGFDEENA